MSIAIGKDSCISNTYKGYPSLPPRPRGKYQIICTILILVNLPAAAYISLTEPDPLPPHKDLAPARLGLYGVLMEVQLTVHACKQCPYYIPRHVT
jgi:hypothetical protein